MKNTTNAQLEKVVSTLQEVLGRIQGVRDIGWHRREEFAKGNEVTAARHRSRN